LRIFIYYLNTWTVSVRQGAARESWGWKMFYCSSLIFSWCTQGQCQLNLRKSKLMKRSITERARILKNDGESMNLEQVWANWYWVNGLFKWTLPLGFSFTYLLDAWLMDLYIIFFCSETNIDNNPQYVTNINYKTSHS
jgi:hypothetical protein